MADPLALMRAASNTGRLADSVKAAWNERLKLRQENTNSQAWDLVLRAQIDEVFLVLAHLGEASLPLGVFNKDFYLQTLGDVKASLSSSGNEMLSMAWDELDAELQYCCCAGFTICAHFSPLPVYRGFGACVLSDWDWACPDISYLEEKARKKAIRTVYGVKQKTDAQPTRSVFQDFDQVIQILQVKSMAFFVKRPPLSGFAQQPRFGTRAKKEVKGELDLLEDWVHEIVRRGHPMPKGQQITSWGFPYSTWSTESNYQILKTEKDCERLLLNDMDPGRLLHAFVCRRAANLDEHSMFLLLPKSPAESLLCWLEGLPGMTHKIIRWEDLDTEAFEKKIGKSMRKKIGQVPVPTKFVVKDPNAGSRPELVTAESSPAVLEHPNTVSPPPYSPTLAPRGSTLAEAPNRTARAASQPAAELAGPETQELPAVPVEPPTQPPQNVLKERASTPGLKSIHTLRRKVSSSVETTVASTAANATTATRHPTVLRPGGQRGRSSSNWMIEDAPMQEDSAQEPAAIEMPAENRVPTRNPVPNISVQPPPDCAELPATDNQEEEKATSITTSSAPSDTRDVSATNDAPSALANTQSSPAPTAAPGNEYLVLLNKVARGEISPQVLAEMLQNGNVGSPPAPSQHPEITAADGPSPAVPVPQHEQTSGEKPRILPYPESPIESKPQ